jgi:hypothetical protein
MIVDHLERRGVYYLHSWDILGCDDCSAGLARGRPLLVSYGNLFLFGDELVAAGRTPQWLLRGRWLAPEKSECSLA